MYHFYYFDSNLTAYEPILTFYSNGTGAFHAITGGLALPAIGLSTFYLILWLLPFSLTALPMRLTIQTLILVLLLVPSNTHFLTITTGGYYAIPESNSA